MKHFVLIAIAVTGFTLQVCADEKVASRKPTQTAVGLYRCETNETGGALQLQANINASCELNKNVQVTQDNKGNFTYCCILRPGAKE